VASSGDTENSNMTMANHWREWAALTARRFGPVARELEPLVKEAGTALVSMVLVPVARELRPLVIKAITALAAGVGWCFLILLSPAVINGKSILDIKFIMGLVLFTGIIVGSSISYVGFHQWERYPSLYIGFTLSLLGTAFAILGLIDGWPATRGLLIVAALGLALFSICGWRNPDPVGASVRNTRRWFAGRWPDGEGPGLVAAAAMPIVFLALFTVTALGAADPTPLEIARPVWRAMPESG
jgi:hypothetical protein